MAKVALKYRSAINEITANKSLKLRKFELDDDNWKIISNLLQVLKVGDSFFNSSQILIVCVRYIKMRHFFSRKTKFQQSQMLFQLWTALTQCSVMPPLSHSLYPSSMRSRSLAKASISTIRKLIYLMCIAL